MRISSVGATLGFFDGSAYSASKAGTLLFPAVVNGQHVAQNRRRALLISLPAPASSTPQATPSGSPYSGMVQYKDQAFNNPGSAFGPRVGFAWDVLGNGKTGAARRLRHLLRPRFRRRHERRHRRGVGPLMAPPAFQAPAYYNTNFSQLLNAQGFLTRRPYLPGLLTRIPRPTTGVSASSAIWARA